MPSLSVSAQKPDWISVAELLISSMGQADAQLMSQVMHRCTALNMTLAAVLAEDSPTLSAGYESQGLKMMQNGILIEANLEKARTGLEPDIAAQSTHAATVVKANVADYNAWLSDNYNNGGSFFNKDFEIEMKGCELASKFVTQLSEE